MKLQSNIGKSKDKTFSKSERIVKHDVYFTTWVVEGGYDNISQYIKLKFESSACKETIFFLLRTNRQILISHFENITYSFPGIGINNRNSSDFRHFVFSPEKYLSNSLITLDN